MVISLLLAIADRLEVVALRLIELFLYLYDHRASVAVPQVVVLVLVRIIL